MHDTVVTTSRITAGRRPGSRTRHRPANLNDPSPRAHSSWVVWSGVVLTYLVLAAIANLPAWLHGASHHLQDEGGDLPQQVWFLASTAYSLAHGHNPFVTNYVNYPLGANLMANTTMFLPGLVLAPITFLFGAVASFNVLMVASIAGSAIAAFALFRKWASTVPAFFGGLLYGFSPYIVGAGYGHLNVLLIVFPPLLVLVLHKILVTQGGRPMIWGIILGVLVTAQFFTSTDILASAAVMSVCGVVVLALFSLRTLRARAPYAIKATMFAVPVIALLCAYPIWVLLFGPQHINGPLHPLTAEVTFSTDLLGPILPTANQAVAPAALQHISNRFVGNDFSENASYIGIPLLVVSLVVLVSNRRSSLVRFAGLMALIALVLSFGPRLQIDGHITSVRLPYIGIRHTPLLQNLLPVRFSIYVFLFLSLLLAVGLSRLQLRLQAFSQPSRLIATSACAGVALFPLVPHWPYPTRNTTGPVFFESHLARTIPNDSVLLPFPFATAFHDEAMLWQSHDGFAWHMPGGYMLIPGPRGVVTLGPGSLTENLLEDAYSGSAMPALTPPVLCGVLGDLLSWHIGTVVVTPMGTQPEAATRLFSLALATSPERVGGVDVFYHALAQRNASAARLGCRSS